LFLSVVEDLISNDPLVVADLRLLSLVQMFRSPHLNTFMLFLTYLGNWQIVAAGACLFGVYLALTRQRRGILALLISILGGELLVWLGKTGFVRPRPDLVNALIPAQGLSFPSGQAFVAISFYGFVSWFVIERTKTKVAKVSIVVLATVLVLAIGFSRIYLGVRWPSDVLAGQLRPRCSLARGHHHFVQCFTSIQTRGSSTKAHLGRATCEPFHHCLDWGCRGLQLYAPACHPKRA